jgi:D-alanine-D-alanine ligase
MRIGLTYDLRADYLAAGYGDEETAEFDSPITINALDQAVRALGHTTDRIGNARQLIARLARGDRWDLVVNIAEGLYGLGREAQVPAILDVYQIPYTFSDPLVTALCLHKGLTKLVVRDAGLATPDFAVVERPDDVARVDLPFPLFAKPVAEGTGKGIGPSSKIGSRAELETVCRGLLERYRQPALVETYLPGREMTIGLWGTGPEAEVIGSMEITLLAKAEAHAYSFVNKEQCNDRVKYHMVSGRTDDEVRRAEELALGAWRALGCRDAGRIDVRSDASGQPQFIEVNPLAGVNPEHSDLPMICAGVGVSYDALIGRIVKSAMERMPAGPRPQASAPVGSE